MNVRKRRQFLCSAERWILVLMTLVLTSCVPESFAQTPFARESSDAASTLSAAAITIEYLHTGKIDRRYATSSMFIYRESLIGIPQKLPGLPGSPGDETLGPVLEGLVAAQDILDRPCFEETCDWSGQVAELRAVSEDLLELSA